MILGQLACRALTCQVLEAQPAEEEHLAEIAEEADDDIQYRKESLRHEIKAA